MPTLAIRDDQLVTQQDFANLSIRNAPAAKVAPRPAFPSVGMNTLLDEPEPPPAAEQPVQFSKIGKGLPLTIFIHEVYTGVHPKNPMFRLSNGADMMVGTAVKGVDTFDAKALALNYLSRNVEPRTRLGRPGATEVGTPLVYYSPAMRDDTITMDVKIAFDRLDERMFLQAADILDAAAGMPAFFAASGYMLAAGQLLRIGGNLLNSVFDNKPAFTSSFAINLDLPGYVSNEAKFQLAVPNNFRAFDEEFLEQVYVENGKVLDKRTSKVYQGDMPYVMYSLDGRKNDQYKKFVSTAVSSQIMKRFMSDDTMGDVADEIIEALELYNDYKYRREADEIAFEMTTASGAQKKELDKRRKAAIENIVNRDLKPK